MNLDFIALDQQSFSIEHHESWFNVYNPEDPSFLTYELGTIAKKVAGFLATLGELPYIRYHSRPALFSTSPVKSISSELAFLVQEELDLIQKHDPDNPPCRILPHRNWVPQKDDGSR